MPELKRYILERLASATHDVNKNHGLALAIHLCNAFKSATDCSRELLNVYFREPRVYSTHNVRSRVTVSLRRSVKFARGCCRRIERATTEGCNIQGP